MIKYKMRKLLAIIAMVSLSGCATVMSWIPSFSDPNQSAAIINVRASIDQLDCSKEQLPQVERIKQDIHWFMLYSQSKGARQQDVIAVVTPLEETVDDMVKRSQEKQGTEGYCKLKKKIMQSQSERAAATILGRF